MENYKIKLKEISKKFGPDESIVQCLNYPERTNEFVQKARKSNLKYNGGATLFGLTIIILGCLPEFSKCVSGDEMAEMVEEIVDLSVGRK